MDKTIKSWIPNAFHIPPGETRKITMERQQTLVNVGDFTVTVGSMDGSVDTVPMRPRQAWQTPEYINENEKFVCVITANDNGGDVAVFYGRIFPETYIINNPDYHGPIPGYEPVLMVVDGTNGLDTNPGTWAEPLETVSKAISNNADIVLIVDGNVSDYTIDKSDLEIFYLNASANSHTITFDLTTDLSNVIIRGNPNVQALTGPFIAMTGSGVLIDGKIELGSIVYDNPAPAITLNCDSCKISFEKISTITGSFVLHNIIELNKTKNTIIRGRALTGASWADNLIGISINETTAPTGYYNNIIDVQGFADMDTGISGPNTEDSIILNPIFNRVINHIAGTAFKVISDLGGILDYSQNLTTNAETDLIAEIDNPHINEIRDILIDYRGWYADANITGTGATLIIRVYIDDQAGTLVQILNLQELITEGISGSGQILLSGGRFKGNFKITVQSSIAPASADIYASMCRR